MFMAATDKGLVWTYLAIGKTCIFYKKTYFSKQ